MTSSRLIVSGLLALAVTSVSFGQTYIVNWGGDYVAASTDLNNKNAHISGTSTGTNFSTTTTLSPTSGYSGTSGTFYGGAVTDRLTGGASAGWDRFRIQNQGTNDMIDFQIIQGAQGDTHNFHTALVWLKNDFIGTQPQVVFEPASQYAISITNANNSMVDATARWLVRDGSTFYLSQATFTPTNGNFTYTPFVNGTSDGNWAPYNPSGLNIDFDQTASFSNQKFTDITAVGVYFEHDLYRDNYAWAIPSFSVTAAVPEPATIMLLGSVTLGIAGHQFLRYRRKRREANS